MIHIAGLGPGDAGSITIETFELLKNSKLNFVGNVEGKSLFKDVCDVIVSYGILLFL